MSQPGRTAYRGFNYQIRVTVWLALEFLIARKHPGPIIVEPSGGEDAQLLRQYRQQDQAAKENELPETNERGVGAHVGTTSNHQCIIQVKGRSGNHWTAGELLDIIKGGDSDASGAREWPIKTMAADKSATLLFVTDSVLAGDLTGFKVDDPGFTKNPNAIPDDAETKLGKKLFAIGSSILERIGVLAAQHYDAIPAKIDDILRKYLHIPHSSRIACRDDLISRFQEGMLYESRATITVDELRAIAKKHGALPGGPSLFVKPRNWTRIQKCLKENHAIVLLGDPGVGKTTAAESLVYEHRTLDEPYLLVQPKSSAELGSQCDATEPTIVYIEDPFGKYKPGDRDDEWFDALERFCRDVRPDLKLVVTSRTSFANRYLGDKEQHVRLRKFIFQLDGKMYDSRALLAKHVEAERSLDPAIRPWLESNEDVILSHLVQPYSYSDFMSAAINTKAEDRTSENIELIAQGAANAKLRNELVDTLLGQPVGILKGIAAIWIAFEAWPHDLDIRERLKVFEKSLLDLEAEVSGAMEVLLNFRVMESRDGILRIHPIRLETCSIVLQKRNAIATKVVTNILQNYVQDADVQDAAAIFRVAMRNDFVFAGVKSQLADLAIRVLKNRASSVHQNREEFECALELVADAGQLSAPIAMVAHALCRGISRPRKNSWVFAEWHLPEWFSDEAIRKSVAQHPDVPTIIRAFIRHEFPTIGREWHPGAPQMVEFLYALTDVSAEFDSLVDRIDDFWDFTVEVVAYGAAHSKNADPDRLLRRALVLKSEYDVWSKELYPCDEDSYAAMEHFADEAHTRARPFLAIVDAVLEVQALLGEPAFAASRNELLVYERFFERIKAHTERDVAVIRRVFDACAVDRKKGLVAAVARTGEQFELILELLAETASHDWVELLNDSIRSRRSSRQFTRALDLLREHSKSLPAHERVALAYASKSDDDLVPLYDDLVHGLADVERTALSSLQAESGAESHNCEELLGRIADLEGTAARAALVALARGGYPVDDRVEAWLSPGSNIDDAVAALDAVQAGILSRGLKFGLRGLAHPRAQVRKRALQLLGTLSSPEAIEAIVAAENDPTPTVRINVARALASNLTPAAWESLVRLLADSTDTSENARDGYWRGEYDPEYGVAQAAAEVLASARPWPEPLQSMISDFLSQKRITRSTVAPLLE